jgi:hypothetical protein
LQPGRIPFDSHVDHGAAIQNTPFAIATFQLIDVAARRDLAVLLIKR